MLAAIHICLLDSTRLLSMQWFLVPFMGNPHLCLLFSIGLIIMLIIIVVVVIIIIIKK